MPPARTTKVLYIPPFEWAKEGKVLDLTYYLDGAYEDSFTPEFKQSAERLVSSSPPPPTIFIIARKKWYSNSSIVATDQSGAHLAECQSPIMSHGCTQITFPTDSCHCGHVLNVVPRSTSRRTQSFVKDSATYVWESLGRSTPGFLSLYREIGATRTQVARYESHSGRFQCGGLLVLDKEVGELVGVLTCIAMLNQRDAVCF